MSRICNKQPERQMSLLDKETNELYGRVDAPIATGSAHFMRAGSELHLLHVDLELNNPRQAAVRVSCAAAAVRSALTEYESSHAIALELGFYGVHDDRLRAAGHGAFRVRETLREARDKGLVALDDAAVTSIDRRFAEGGDEAAFTHFIEDLREFSADLDNFDRAAAQALPAQWLELSWRVVTEFDRIRIYGQALAIINILGTADVAAPAGA
ncbi:hypothetical protein ACQB60_31855 [Actinomycetota bacterium Odt1-20B]